MFEISYVLFLNLNNQTAFMSRRTETETVNIMG